MTPEEYRKNLSEKITKLTTVLVDAISKIETAMTKDGANAERLSKIRDNLANTLQILQRAQDTLNSKRTTGNAPSGIREYTEMSSVDEYRKFQKLEPITLEEIADVDWKELTDKLKDI